MLSLALQVELARFDLALSGTGRPTRAIGMPKWQSVSRESMAFLGFLVLLVVLFLLWCIGGLVLAATCLAYFFWVTGAAGWKEWVAAALAFAVAAWVGW